METLEQLIESCDKKIKEQDEMLKNLKQQLEVLITIKQIENDKQS